MKIIRQLTYFLIVLLFLTVSSCIKETPLCHHAYRYFTWDSIVPSNLDNSGSEVLQSTNNQISAAALGLRLTFFKNPSVRNTAGGDTCVYYISKEKISYIRIHTLNTFDNLHPQFSDITDYFTVATKDPAIVGAYSYNTFQTFNEFLYTDTSQSTFSQVDFLLKKTPSASGTFKFYFEIQKENTSDTLYTAPVNLH